MRPRSLFLFAALVLVGAACATGSKIAGTGGGDTGGAGGDIRTSAVASTTADGTTSDATSAAVTTGDASSSSTSSATAASSSGSGPMCAESPCKLTLPQCGCAQGEECTVAPSGRSCIPAGAVQWGQECTGNECVAGLLCVIASSVSMVSMCGKFCATDADCLAPGGLCILSLNDGMNGSIPNVTLCTESCDPTTNAGCAVPGTACQLGQEAMGQMRAFTRCLGSGAGQQGATCKGTDDCAPKLGCFNTDPNNPMNATCLQYCKVNAPSCPGGTTCHGFSTPALVGPNEFGACL